MARYVAVQSVLMVEEPCFFFDEDSGEWIPNIDDATKFETEKEASLWSRTVWRVE